MNITATAVAVTLAVVVAVAFLFLGPGILTPFQGEAQQADTLNATTTTMTDESGNPVSVGHQQGAAGAGGQAAGQAPRQLPTTLTVSDTVVGTGAEAKAGDTVTVNYVGMLPNGTIFDASEKHGQAFSFKLGAGQVIPGWDKGIAGMKVGGKRELIIPPDMAYGSRDLGAIPPNSTLIFQVELLKVGS
jgi:peptidylprolyl isomerase